MDLFLLLNTNEDILKNVGNLICLVTNILQNIFFWVQPEKEMHTGLEQL